MKHMVSLQAENFRKRCATTIALKFLWRSHKRLSVFQKFRKKSLWNEKVSWQHRNCFLCWFFFHFKSNWKSRRTFVFRKYVYVECFLWFTFEKFEFFPVHWFGVFRFKTRKQFFWNLQRFAIMHLTGLSTRLWLFYEFNINFTFYHLILSRKMRLT